MSPLQFEPAGPPLPKCGAWKSKRSTARCELPPGHDGAHFGRTYGGYWKWWPHNAAFDEDRDG